MTRTEDGSPQIFLLGVAEHKKSQSQGLPPFPLGPINIFNFSQTHYHIFFPVDISAHSWIICVEQQFFEMHAGKQITLRISNESGVELGTAKAKLPEQLLQIAPVDGHHATNEGSDVDVTLENKQTNNTATDTNQEFTKMPIAFSAHNRWSLIYFSVPISIQEPGIISVSLDIDDTAYSSIGSVSFVYAKVYDFTAEQINALKSRPQAINVFAIVLGCKLCPTKMNVYTGFERNQKLESDGFIWYRELPDEFQCECGASHYSLDSMRESMHGALAKDAVALTGKISYERRYAHSELEGKANQFRRLLSKAKEKESTFQKFLEKNFVFFARFRARSLYIKPRILGKFETDFAALTTSGELLLIEIEKPSTRLFKRDGNLAQGLTHACGQIQDWLVEYRSHPQAVIEGMNLQHENITRVKGVVIAGRDSAEKTEHFKRFHTVPVYPDIELVTYDDLINSMLQLSQSLA